MALQMLRASLQPLPRRQLFMTMLKVKQSVFASLGPTKSMAVQLSVFTSANSCKTRRHCELFSQAFNSLLKLKVSSSGQDRPSKPRHYVRTPRGVEQVQAAAPGGLRQPLATHGVTEAFGACALKPWAPTSSS